MEAKPRVCIIGAGTAGLLAMWHLSQVADVTCYEVKAHIGGLWNSKDKTP